MQGGVYLSHVPETVQDYHVKNSFLLNESDVGRPFIKAMRRVFRKEPYDDNDANSFEFKNYVHPLSPDFDIQLWPKDGIKEIIPDVTILLPKRGEFIKIESLYGKTILVGQITPSGIYVGHNPVYIDYFPPNILTPSLASLCASILAQEIIRLTNCLREIFVLDQSIEAVCHLKSEIIRQFRNQPEAPIPIEARLKLGGELIKLKLIRFDDDNPDEAVFSLVFPSQTLLTRLITDSIEFIEEPLRKKAGIKEEFFFSFLEGEKLENAQILIDKKRNLPTFIDKLNALILGVGGIGTWLSALLAISPVKNLLLTLIDYDHQVEEHNLNRQVLYSISDLGKPKVKAAYDALLRINRNLNIHIYELELDQILLKYLNENATEDYKEIEQNEKQLYGEKMLEILDKKYSMLAGDFQKADLIFSCPDNMFTRLILNAASWLERKIFINAGIKDGLIGQVDFIDTTSDDECLVQRFGLQQMLNKERQQCGGSVPIPSIVTSNSFVASVQAIFGLIAAINERPKSNFISYDGRRRIFLAVKRITRKDETNIKDVSKILLEELDVQSPKRLD
ncbi:MAG: ThiF family adenylyltransferase [Candidatus Aminicenantes bacterium]|nr:ThiF family adenylyltransferase [Candidatus Aminicenantes bacterium]